MFPKRPPMRLRRPVKGIGSKLVPTRWKPRVKESYRRTGWTFVALALRVEPAHLPKARNQTGIRMKITSQPSRTRNRHLRGIPSWKPRILASFSGTTTSSLGSFGKLSPTVSTAVCRRLPRPSCTNLRRSISGRVAPTFWMLPRRQSPCRALMPRPRVKRRTHLLLKSTRLWRNNSTSTFE
jgi:hypothetical protein